MKNILYIVIFVLMAVNMLPSCTNLDETIYSELESDSFYTNESEMIMSVGQLYTYAQGWCNYLSVLGALLISSDEAICPCREGGLWWDNGDWITLHTHEFNSYSDVLKRSWDYFFSGISKCNQVLYTMEQSTTNFETKLNLIAEVKVMRAWFYMNAMDMFGDVPLTTDFRDTELHARTPRKEVYDFIEKEFKDNVDLLPQHQTPSNIGRPTQAMAYTCLAKLYLNAKEWAESERWQECVDACDKIINMNAFELENDYFANFAVNNENSKENIFVIVYDNARMGDTGRGFNHVLLLHQYTLHSLSQETFNITDFCWDGFAATESLWKSYDEKDIRRNSWLEGLQYASNGAPLMITNDRQLNYRPEIRSLGDGREGFALVDDGVRLCKYEYEKNLQGSMSNDWVVYRYADILMMKGEALVRLNKASEALPYFNKIRERAGVFDYKESDLTLDEILAERSREFAWECLRRQDLIRFDKWGNAWDFKPVSSSNKKLFPIPNQALNTNPNLVQNEGYN